MMDDEQLRAEVLAAEAWLDQLDPQTVVMTDATDLRALIAAVENDADDEHLTAVVTQARVNGCRWGLIGAVLGMSKQDARERYGPTVLPRSQK
jgi:hypothetical protein